ncbi:MAG: hypothetical protein AB8F65_14555 [Woeseiaceae bacterium]
MPNKTPPESPEKQGTESRVNGISRRGFLRLQAIAAGLVGLPACHWSADEDDRSALRIFRADDQLELNVSLVNLQMVSRRREASLLRRRDVAEPAYIVIQLPGQSIAETVYDSVPTGATTANTQIAGPTRLAFRWPDLLAEMPLDLEHILDWDAWVPVTDGALRSAIDLPAGLSLTPQGAGRWHHATRPITYNGRTELWHTRWRSDQVTTPMRISEAARPLPALDSVGGALNAADRKALIRNQQAQVRTLALSPFGGYLDLYGQWDDDPAASITRWEHAVRAGQDQRVVIQRQDGFLYPFGQRAALLSVTEREVVSGQALLRRRKFIVIRQPDVGYAAGAMAFQQLKALESITPALHADTPEDGAFWVTLTDGTSHPFAFSATDWDGSVIDLQAPAVFCSDDAVTDAARLYAAAEHAALRVTDTGGESVVIAPFLSHERPDSDAWGAPLEHPRGPGDTQVTLLQVEFAGLPAATADEMPFRCATPEFSARLPSLSAFLPEPLNQGWFRYQDPDVTDGSNKAELFGIANTDRSKKIPLSFEQQSDRCGGLITPSYDVDGLSRVLGPISNATAVTAGDGFSLGDYFSDRAMLLGAVPLQTLFRPFKIDGGVSPNLPQLRFAVDYKQPDPPKQAQWRATANLSWSLGLPNLEASLLSFESRDDSKPALLKLSAELSKVLKRSSTDDDDTSDEPEGEEKAQDATEDNGVDWSAVAKLTDFNLKMTAFPDTGFVVGFDELGVKLGPAKKEKKKPTEEKTESTDDPDQPDEDNSDEWPVSVSKVVKIAEMRGTGALSFINPLIDFAEHLPEPPELSFGEAAPDFPASLPGIGDADISVTLGPIEAPKFNWLQFEVSNVSASFGMGLYLFPKPDGSKPNDPLFTLRIASANKPVTLIAEPWGGTAFVAINFSTRQLTGLQCGVGLVYRVTLKFGVGIARCEGSLTLVYTYLKPDADVATQDIGAVVRLNGVAVIAGWIHVSLSLVAIGKWNTAEGWLFAGEVVLRVQVAFFAVTARVGFSHAMGNPDNDRMLGAAPECVDVSRMERDDWQRYRAAFSGSVA